MQVTVLRYDDGFVGVQVGTIEFLGVGAIQSEMLIALQTSPPEGASVRCDVPELEPLAPTILAEIQQGKVLGMIGNYTWHT